MHVKRPRARSSSRLNRLAAVALAHQDALPACGASASLVAPVTLMVEAWQGSEIDAPAIAAGSIAMFLLVLGRLLIVLLDLRRTLQERQILEAELQHQALHDPLTRLANRTLFSNRVEHALARRGQSTAVMFIDLDDFKIVNDTLGHSAGDELLTVIAGRLRAALRGGDTAARLGGDEFAVLLEDCPDVSVGGAVAERLLEAIAQPVPVKSATLSVNGSIGLALGVAGGTSGEELMRDADVAMYVAKGRGKGRYALHEPGTLEPMADGPEAQPPAVHAAEPGRRVHQPARGLAGSI